MNKTKLLSCIILVNFIAFLTIPFVSEAEESKDSSLNNSSHSMVEWKLPEEEAVSPHSGQEEAGSPSIDTRNETEEETLEESKLDAEETEKPPEKSKLQKERTNETSYIEKKKESEEVELASVDPSLTSEEVRDEKPQIISETKSSQIQNQTNQIQPLQEPSLLDIQLLSDKQLSIDHIERNELHEITLTFTGKSVLNLELFSKTTMIFSLPNEIAEVISKENLQASYDIPGKKGDFSQEEIHLEKNTVYMKLENLIELSLFAKSEFTLTITLDHLPPTETGEYVFYAEAVKGAWVDLTIISGNPTSVRMNASEFPEKPVIEEPVYSNDTMVTGAGTSNIQIVLRTNGEEYSGWTDNQGRFSINILQQEAGTEIRALAVDENGYASEATSTIVREPPDITPPAAPKIDSVYSNDTEVTGTGEPGTGIVLTIEEQVYEGTVDENGNYSVPIPVQNPGTRISAVLIDKAGNTSEVTESTVIAATISFYQVPDELRFEATAIRPGVVRVPRQDPDWSIKVKDTRGPGSEIQLLAKADPLVSEGKRHTLPDALVYVDETGESRSLSDKPIEVFRGQTGDVPISTIQWDKEEGPYVEVDPADAYAGSYRTTITWTLVDAP